MREVKATPEELGSGTFTLNNYGVFGVDGSAAIINHPEVAILGVGRIIDKPWVVDGELAVHHVTELTLTFDHRVRRRHSSRVPQVRSRRDREPRDGARGPLTPPPPN